MKIGICAQAKWENSYINEWVKYHLNNGYDIIYLYDNNNIEDEYVGNFIEKEYLDRVKIIDIRGKNSLTKEFVVYNKWFKEYKDDVDWCTFIDIDEFVVGNIRACIKKCPKECNFILLNWQMYGDDDIIIGDVNKPVRERIKIKQGDSDNIWNRTVKVTVRCKNTEDIVANSSHSFMQRGKKSLYCNCYGEIIDYDPMTLFSKKGEHKDFYIAHYATKTLSEFIDNKINRLGLSFKDKPLKYFFRFNKKTEEKIKYLLSRGIKINTDYL